MATGTGGIDQQVTALADAYRSNPAALQKNYKVNQNLLDLLALQKIKSEKDAAKREIEMSQQPESQTVAQQRADEAVGRSKNEIVEQVGGIAQLQKGRQQQNLQRMAAGAPSANQPAQMTGIANQPAPNMARMAEGGIVSFAGPKGSAVKSPTPEELLREAGYKGSMQDFYNLSIGERNRVLSTINDRRASRRPGAEAATGAYMLDVAASPGRFLGDVLSPIGRELGLLNPEEKGLWEGEHWGFTNELNKRAASPENQPVDMSKLMPLQGEDINTAGMVLPPSHPAFGLAPAPAAAAADPTDSTDPVANPIPDTSLPVPEIGAVDKTAVDNFVTPQSRIPNERNFELAQAQAKMRKGLSGLETRMGQDATAAGTGARDEAAKFQDRTGVQAAYGDMYRDRKVLADRQAADRKANLWRTLGAGAGGEGGLANIARTATNERAAEQLREQRDLGGLQDLQKGRLTADQAIAKESLAAGQKAEDLTQQDINNATTNHRAVMSDLEGSISKEADRGLKIDELNMNAEQWEAQIRFDTILAKLKDSTQRIVAEYNGKIRARGQDVQLRAIESDDRSTIIKGIEATDRMITDIRVSIEAAVQDAIEAKAIDSDYIAMDETEKANHKNQLRRDITEAFEAQIISQQALRERLRLKFEGAIEGMRNPTGAP